MLQDYLKKFNVDINNISTRHLSEHGGPLNNQLRALGVDLTNGGNQNMVKAIQYLGGQTINGTRDPNEFNLTDRQINEQLWVLRNRGVFLTPGGLKRMGGIGHKLWKVLTTDPSFTRELFVEELQTPEGKKLATHIGRVRKHLTIPTSAHKQKDIVQRARGELEFVLQTALFMDPTLEQTNLSNHLERDVTEIVGYRQNKQRHYQNAQGEIGVAPFRVKTTNRDVFVDIVPFSLDAANVSELIDEYAPITAWRNGEQSLGSITDKILVFARPNLNGIHNRRAMEREGIQAMSMGEVEERYREAKKVVNGIEPNFFGKDTKNNIFYRNLTSRLRTIDPTITEEDVAVYHDNRIIGKLSELEMGLMFRIIKQFDPNLDHVTALKKYFPSGFLDITLNFEKKKVAIANKQMTSGFMYPDLHMVDGDFGQIILDVKRYEELIPSTLKKIYNNYLNLDEEENGKKTYTKVLLFNSPVKNLDTYEGELKEKGFVIINYDDATDAYEQSQRLLLSKNYENGQKVRNFWRDTDVPNYGSEKEQLTTLLRAHNYITKRAHLLFTKAGQTKQEYTKGLLQAAIKSLDELIIGQSSLRSDFLIGRSECDEIPSRQIVPLESFIEKYDESARPFLYELLANNTLDLKHFFFYDLETNGWVKDREIINTIGMAYQEDGKLLLQLNFVKNPYRQVDALAEFKSLSKERKYLVGVNSVRFDTPYAQSQFSTDLMNYVIKNTNVDLLPALRQLKKENDWPNAKLQTFEQRILNKGKIMRHGDIDADIIPESHRKYMFGDDQHLAMNATIDHCGIDVVSEVFLLLYAHQNGLLTSYDHFKECEYPMSVVSGKLTTSDF